MGLDARYQQHEMALVGETGVQRLHDPSLDGAIGRQEHVRAHAEGRMDAAGWGEIKINLVKGYVENKSRPPKNPRYRYIQRKQPPRRGCWEGKKSSLGAGALLVCT